MVFVASGMFLMGSDPDVLLAECIRIYRGCRIEDNVIYFNVAYMKEKLVFDFFIDEVPQHNVFLDGFWIDKTEVTNKMYLLCVQDWFLLST